MSDVYENDSFFLAYIKWHYRKGLKELLYVSQNFLWFVIHFFSFELLIKTLFAPWKRLGETYDGGFNLSAFASTFIVNSLMRAVGFFTKILVLFVGAISYIVVLAFSICILVIWILAPVILVGSLVLSVTFFVI